MIGKKQPLSNGIGGDLLANHHDPTTHPLYG
jgi:hypothetical protein